MSPKIFLKIIPGIIALLFIGIIVYLLISLFTYDSKKDTQIIENVEKKFDASKTKEKVDPIKEKDRIYIDIANCGKIEGSKDWIKDGGIWQLLNKSKGFSDKRFVPKLVNSSLPGLTVKVGKVLNTALLNMEKEAKKNGVTLGIQYGYRSFEQQQSLYSPNSTSAQIPGHSEHQSGLAIDFSKPNGIVGSGFENADQGKWLKKNSWKFGFILRYNKGQTKTTGIEFEPWHYRYVGNELATFMNKCNIKNLEDVHKHIIK